jgi:uncharacterized protein with von Willebrand factor type A (vWA) domain
MTEICFEVFKMSRFFRSCPLTQMFRSMYTTGWSEACSEELVISWYVVHLSERVFRLAQRPSPKDSSFFEMGDGEARCQRSEKTWIPGSAMRMRAPK